jgi:hypothetical protein
MSPQELAGLADEAGWQVTDMLPGATYAVVLARS